MNFLEKSSKKWQKLEHNCPDEDDPWKGNLCVTASAVRATLATLQDLPAQLVFGRDMILNINHVANWEHIEQRKQALINKNNDTENTKKIPHTCSMGNKVLPKRGTETKHESPHEGPCSILKIHDDGTIRL